jgi:MFS family permease
MINIQIINGMLITLAPAFVENILGIKLETGTLLVVLPLGLGVILGNLLLGIENQYIKRRNIILLGFFGIGAGLLSLLLLQVVTYKLTLYFILGFILGIFNAQITAPSHSVLQSHAVDEVRGRVYGTLFMLLQVAATLPTFIAGILADEFSVLAVMALLGVYSVIVGLFLTQQKSGHLSTS